MREDAIGLISRPARDSAVHHFQHVKSLDLANIALAESTDELSLQYALGFTPTLVPWLRVQANEFPAHGLDLHVRRAPAFGRIDAFIDLTQDVDCFLTSRRQ